MKKIGFWTVTAGAAALLAACGQQESADNTAAKNVMNLPPATIAPSNEVGDVNEASEMNVAEDSPPQVAAPAEEPKEPEPKARAEAPRSAPPKPPVQKPAKPAAPKPEASPTPASTCTPEHEAMGHCKR